jgi:hypothetical protein
VPGGEFPIGRLDQLVHMQRERCAERGQFTNGTILLTKVKSLKAVSVEIQFFSFFTSNDFNLAI